MKRHKAVLAILGVTLSAWISPACGGESEEDKKSSGGSGGSGGTGGSSGGDASSDVVVEAQADGAPDSAKCVASECPGFSSFVSGCCLPSGECGYDGSALGYDCVSQDEIGKLLEGGFDVQVPPDATDPTCPEYTVGGYTLKGCCPSSGFCGVYAPILNNCYDWAEMPKQVPKPDNIVPTACGGGPKDASAD